MTTMLKRALWIIGGIVVIGAALVLLSIPRFANTGDRAALTRDEALARGGADMVELAAVSAPAGLAASAGDALLRLPSAGELQAQVPADTARLLIRTGTMEIEVESLETAVAAVAQAARAVSGFIANTSTWTTENQRSATIEVKVPAARFDAAVERLRALGEVQSVQVQVEDVGEEYLDVAARMANARRLEARLLELLTTRAGRLTDVLEVEREVARVREQIERYQGRLQYLRQHAALSTLSVRVFEPGTVIGSQPGLGVIGDAFKQAWRNFIWLVAFLVQSLGVVLPLGLLAFGGWWLWKRLRGAGAGA